MSYFKQLILLSLMVLVPSSSFSFYDYFKQHSLIQQGLVQQSVGKVGDSAILVYALKQNHISAHRINFSTSQEGSISWLNSASRLAEVDPVISAELGRWYFLSGNFMQAEKYLIKAHQQGIQAAANLLVQLWQRKEEHQKIINLELNLNLNHSSQLNIDLATAKVNALMVTDEQAKLKEFATKLSEQSNLQPLYSELQQYKVLMPSEPVKRIEQIEQAQSASQCPLSITLLANGLADLRRWQQLASQYNKSSLKQFMCIAEVRYVAPYVDACTLDASAPIRCDEAKLASQLNPTTAFESDYIALMLPKGGANVHMGILYLDRADNGHVFNHEIAHLLGFIDEYQVTKNHSVCQSASSELGWNIATVNNELVKTGYIDRQNLKKLPWYEHLAPYLEANQKAFALNQTLTPQGLGVFFADTCLQSNEVRALKPLKGNTLMSHHDYDLPILYANWLNNSDNKFKMPSYHYNFGVALYRLQKGKEALVWLNKARH